MTEPAWTFQYSIECNTSRQFAWNYWTDISKWDDPPAKFELDGRFDVGSRITSTLPGQTWHSFIRHVEPGRSATIETLLPDGTLSFHWKFEDVAESRTRISQRLVLTTAKAELVAQASLLEQSVPPGMNKLISAIEQAFNEKARRS